MFTRRKKVVLPKALDGFLPEAVALACRVRIARKRAGERFPDWATPPDRARVRDRVFAALHKVAPKMLTEHMDELPELHRGALVEEHIASRDLLQRKDGAGIALDPGHPELSVLVNEEDHLRIQAYAPALSLGEAWKLADAFDSQLDAELPFAWSAKLGYLTACPSNLGTAIRASVLLHLPGLGMMGEIEQVLNGLDRLRIAVRGMNGEGSDAAGFVYQFSNLESLGVSEEDIVKRVSRIALAVTEQELSARIRLMEQRPAVLMDGLSRALALLGNARVMTSNEASTLLSVLRLGVTLGLVFGLDMQAVERLLGEVQPYHLRLRMNVPDVSDDEADIFRAKLLRGKMRGVTLGDLR